MKCPYCAEDIQPQAQKCKHCGEWLNKSSPPQVVDASAQARAVAKGIKKQKQDEFNSGCLVSLGLIFSVVVGVSIGGNAGLWVGVIIFVGGAIFASTRYHKE